MNVLKCKANEFVGGIEQSRYHLGSALNALFVYVLCYL